MNSPRLSVIIPCYNQGKYIMDTLSCFDDYHQQDTYELIIVDDGSKDEKTLSVLKQIASEGYQVIYQSNQGVSSARNNGIQHARGEYILPLDGDDMLSKEYIYEGITILDEHPEYAVVYCDGQYFGDKTGPWKVGSFNLQRLMLWDYIHVSGIYRKSAWAKVGGYDTHLNFLGFEDWDFWLSVAFSGGRFYYLEKPFFAYRIRPDSMVRTYTGEVYKKMQDYIDQKHAAYISKTHLNDHLVLFMKRSKRLWIKLFLRIYFPKFLNRMVKKGKIDSTNIFY